MAKSNIITTAFSELMRGQLGPVDQAPESAEGEAREMERDAIDGTSVRRVYNFDKTSDQQTPQSVIEKDVVIDGSISSESSLRVAGTVKGNIKCQSTLTVSGAVQGDLTAQSIEMLGARINGNTFCASMLNVDEKSVLVGDIETEDMRLSGKVKGDINVTGDTIVGPEALIVGDLRTNTISVERGAKLSGMVSTKSSSKDLLQSFPEAK